MLSKVELEPTCGSTAPGFLVTDESFVAVVLAAHLRCVLLVLLLVRNLVIAWMNISGSQALSGPFSLLSTPIAAIKYLLGSCLLYTSDAADE